MTYFFFPTGPTIKFLKNELVCLCAEYCFDVNISEKIYSVIIKPGFKFDGASIPRLFWRVIGHPLEYPLICAALGHDAIYAAELFTRNECDWIFLELMQQLNISWLKRNIIFSAVKIGGFFIYKKHTPESVSEARQFVYLIDKGEGIYGED